jgi:hypothetical protein
MSAGAGSDKNSIPFRDAILQFISQNFLAKIAQGERGYGETVRTNTQKCSQRIN